MSSEDRLPFRAAIRAAERALRDLPRPDPDAAAHCERLRELIRAELAAAGGSLSFARYMELALYAPGFGYYSAGARKFGAEGDFVTAPEISPLFGRCVARQCRQVLELTGGGDILEIGAGTGALAADLLGELEHLGQLPERYLILELSGELRERQQALLRERLPHLLPRVRWLERLPEPGFQGVVLGNEVLDAMPVHRFRWTRQGVYELRVAWEGDDFGWRAEPAEPRLADAVAALHAEVGEAWPDGFESEINLGLAAWVRSLGERLARGVVLLVDYGYPRREYYHPQRAMGTLVCHYRHRAHADPLLLPGLQDITAFVDFTAVAEAAVAADLSVAGYTTQAHFLLGCGLGELLAASDPADAQRHLTLTRQAKILTLPGEMGERFKAIALARGIEALLLGFVLQDHRYRL